MLNEWLLNDPSDKLSIDIAEHGVFRIARNRRDPTNDTYKTISDHAINMKNIE
jgi:hypothetical protein